ncbi:hypothetical protein F5887DRAFT_919031 [Amanita rubescens]|nr:hypothetical protein F5887DRAFT_919031 [Amanita rubescens]
MSNACIESIRGLDNYYNICSIVKVEELETGITGPKLHCGKFWKGAMQLLESWCMETHYLQCPWGPVSFVPDNILSSLASKQTIATVQDLIDKGWSTPHAQKHGLDLLCLDLLRCLADYDSGHFKDLEEKSEAKKHETEEQCA